VTQELRRFKAEIFQALAHPTRIAIVETLRNVALVCHFDCIRISIRALAAVRALSVIDDNLARALGFGDENSPGRARFRCNVGIPPGWEVKTRRAAKIL
jgi:hypothetical protein